MENEKIFYKIINEICEEKNIEQKSISYNWIKELKKNNKSHYIMGYEFELNSAVAYNVAKDKFATYEVLKSNNIPTIEHKMIFNPKTRSRYYGKKFIEDAKKLLCENNYKVVIKANDSSQGKDVYFCSTNDEIENVVKKLFQEENDTLSACPYLDIDYEYRVIYLCGEILYVYKKKKAYIVGNAKNTVNELIKAKYTKKMPTDFCKNLDFNYIPQKDEEVTICWKHNLCNYAEPIAIDENDEFIDEVKTVALKAGKTLNINFASIDIALTSDKKVLVMEVNGSVCMNKFAEIMPNGYKIAKEIYAKAIDKMFEE
jgi:glutathione synthase/RimK-type ligase-like ATP-grasp enzyme